MKPRTDQIRFNSSANGTVILDAYMEAAEKGGRALGDLMSDLFDGSGVFRSDIFEFREDPETVGQLQFRVGDYVDPDAGWVDISSAGLQSFVDAAEAAQTAAEAAQAAAEQAVTDAAAEKTAAQSAKTDAEAAQGAAEAARDDAEQAVVDAAAQVTAASGHSSDAEGFANAAAVSATEAAGSAADALDYVTDAAGHADLANTAKLGAETARDAAIAAKDEAESLLSTKADAASVYTKTEADDLLAEKVPTTRTLTAGTGLTGGGTLGADRTLSIETGHNQIGTYALLRHAQTPSTLEFGDFRAGSNLQPANAAGVNSPGSLGGTWKCMGQIGNTNVADGPTRTTLFLKVT